MTSAVFDDSTELRGDFAEYRDLALVQMGAVAHFMQKAKGIPDWATYRRAVALADTPGARWRRTTSGCIWEPTGRHRAKLLSNVALQPTIAESQDSLRMPPMAMLVHSKG